MRVALVLLLALCALGQRAAFYGANLAAHSSGSHYVSLSWTNAGYVTSNNIYRGTQTGGPYTLIYASGGVTSGYVDTGCVGYCFYIVTSLNANGESTDSNEASAYVP